MVIQQKCFFFFFLIQSASLGQSGRRNELAEIEKIYHQFKSLCIILLTVSTLFLSNKLKYTYIQEKEL